MGAPDAKKWPDAAADPRPQYPTTENTKTNGHKKDTKHNKNTYTAKANTFRLRMLFAHTTCSAETRKSLGRTEAKITMEATMQNKEST